MQSHRIPMHVTSYESRIIGKFTAKQFTYLAIGGILIFIIGTSPLPKVAKVPLLFVVIGFTILFALVNYEGRSTDIWLVQFFKSVLAPTQRIWLKSEVTPAYLLPEFFVPKKRLGVKRRRKDELNQFLSFWKGERRKSFLTPTEQDFLQRLKKLGNKVKVPKNPPEISRE